MLRRFREMLSTSNINVNSMLLHSLLNLYLVILWILNFKFILLVPTHVGARAGAYLPPPWGGIFANFYWCGSLFCYVFSLWRPFLPCEGLSATFFFNWEIFFCLYGGPFCYFSLCGGLFPLLRLFLLDGAFLLPFCPYEGPFLGLPLPPLQKFLRAPMYTPPHTI